MVVSLLRRNIVASFHVSSEQNKSVAVKSHVFFSCRCCVVLLFLYTILLSVCELEFAVRVEIFLVYWSKCLPARRHAGTVVRACMHACMAVFCMFVCVRTKNRSKNVEYNVS